MAENKKGFVLYADLIHTINKMPSDKAGDLFKHILSYVNDEDPTTDDMLIELVFEPIKQQLKRDLKKYESICNRNSENGKKGGRPKKQQEPKKPTGLIGNPTEPKKADKDNDTDKDIMYTPTKFLERWKAARLKYDKLPTNISKLSSFELINFNTLKETYTPEQFDYAIGGLFQQETFKATRLRPTHFLEIEHFEKYLTCWQTKEKLYEKKKRIERL